MNLDELFSDLNTQHDEVQCDAFITGGRCRWHQYRQALRELYKRVRGLRSLYIARERNRAEIEILHAEMNGMQDGPEKRLKQLDVLEKSGFQEEADRSIRYTEREFNRFLAQVLVFRKEFGNLTEEEKRQRDLEGWAEEMRLKAAIDLAANGRISLNVIRNVIGLPAALRKQLTNEFKQPKRLLAWLDKQQDTTLALDHAEAELASQEIRRLVEVGNAGLLSDRSE